MSTATTAGPPVPATDRALGRERMRDLARFLHGAFSGADLPVIHVAADNDKVLVHLRMRGRHTGRFAGMPPIGRQIGSVRE
ncbi:MAG: ester cyclase [Gluconacetobacter diazotrophicus]|nr:ester cyclase [Gluconacetobacter diazotrophicus]